MKRLSILIASFILWNSALYADVNSAGTLLIIPAEAKSAAMGEAHMAKGVGADGLWANPATMSKVSAPSLTLMHTMYVEDISMDSVGGTYPFGNQNAVGFGLQYLNVGSIQSYDKNGTAASAYSPKDFNMRLGVSKTWRRTSFGASGTFVRSTIQDSASALTANFGVHQEFDRIDVGVAAENFGGKLKFQDEATPLPSRLRLGLHAKVASFWSVTTDFFKPNTGSASVGVGSEWRASVGSAFGLALRAGYNTGTGKDLSGLSGLSSGAGIRMSAVSLNYAWVPFGDLGTTHRISMDIDFSGLEKFSHSEEREERSPRRRRSETETSIEGEKLNQKNIKKRWPPQPWEAKEGWYRNSDETLLTALSEEVLCTPESPVAVITHVQAGVFMKGESTRGSWKRLKAGNFIFESDWIRTDRKAFAHVSFPNGRRIEIAGDSVVRVASRLPNCERPELILEKGQIFEEKDSRPHEAPLSIKVQSGQVSPATRPVTPPTKASIPGRWDDQFTAGFKKDLFQLEKSSGLAVAEYIRDSSLRKGLSSLVFDQKKLKSELEAQRADFKRDRDEFASLMKDLKQVQNEETLEAKVERMNGFKQAKIAFKRADSSLHGIQNELKKLVQEIRMNQEQLASLPVVRMLNITAQESTIPFEIARAVIPEEAVPTLDMIAESIKKMNPARVVVEGHTDKTGSTRVNARLSKERAQVVADYLSQQTGVPIKRFLIRGMGASKPLIEGNDLTSMRKNRRVEIWFELRGL